MVIVWLIISYLKKYKVIMRKQLMDLEEVTNFKCRRKAKNLTDSSFIIINKIQKTCTILYSSEHFTIAGRCNYEQ